MDPNNVILYENTLLKYSYYVKKKQKNKSSDMRNSIFESENFINYNTQTIKFKSSKIQNSTSHPCQKQKYFIGCG